MKVFNGSEVADEPRLHRKLLHGALRDFKEASPVERLAAELVDLDAELILAGIVLDEKPALDHGVENVEKAAFREVEILLELSKARRAHMRDVGEDLVSSQ